MTSPLRKRRLSPAAQPSTHAQPFSLQVQDVLRRLEQQATQIATVLPRVDARGRDRGGLAARVARKPGEVAAGRAGGDGAVSCIIISVPTSDTTRAVEGFTSNSDRTIWPAAEANQVVALDNHVASHSLQLFRSFPAFAAPCFIILFYLSRSIRHFSAYAGFLLPAVCSLLVSSLSPPLFPFFLSFSHGL